LYFLPFWLIDSDLQPLYIDAQELIGHHPFAAASILSLVCWYYEDVCTHEGYACTFVWLQCKWTLQPVSTLLSSIFFLEDALNSKIPMILFVWPIQKITGQSSFSFSVSYVAIAHYHILQLFIGRSRDWIFYI
jgi:hypothetical protein